MPVDSARAKTLFLAAAEIADADQRRGYLDRECAGDPELRDRVEALLKADAGDGTGAYTPNPANVNQPGTSLKAGDLIAGRYTLIEPVGEGGMGSVWRAKQSEPVKRFVAIKLIKAGMDSKQVLTRFEAERQALALMDHPNIAKVLDGGLHEGRPYFVMELVKGVPITEYCDANKLPPQQRLELFVGVCQAIQHAHHKGIIHRDIKPSNVLVAMYDDKPVIKVIDFGVAKATGGTLTEATIDTGFGNIVGTPQYMSPEQATFNNLDIDTRSDVYALGVLLYELLTGTPPFTRKDLEKAGFVEMLRVVREVEPPRPSTKLSTADALPTLSANRGMEPKKLTGLLRNELDWIVMKALEKDRSRRYETANGFAADILRYLASEPVLAHPPSASYRLKKFIRRNKGQVLATNLILGTLIVGLIATSYGFYRADRERERANVAEKNAVENAVKAADSADRERRARVQIASQLKQIELVNDTVFDIFTEFDIRKNNENGDAVEAALAKKLILAGKKLDEMAIADPLVLARTRHRLGVTLINLGYYQDATQFLLAARTTFHERLGPDHQITLSSSSNLAVSYKEDGKFDKALPIFLETFTLTKAKHGADHTDTLSRMNNLAHGYRDAGNFDKARPIFEETLKVMKAKLGNDHPNTLTCMNSLAVTYRDSGNIDMALPLNQEALKLCRAKLGPDHYDTLIYMDALATTYLATKNFDLALTLYEETLKLRQAKLGTDHPKTLESMDNLAEGYRGARKLDLAVSLHEETLKLKKLKLGPDHPSTLTSMSNLAVSYETAGKLELALPLHEQTLKLKKIKFGPDHPATLTSMNNLGRGYLAAGKLDLALPLLEETLKLRKVKLGPDHPATLESMNNLAACYWSLRQLDKSVPLFEELLPLTVKKFGRGHPDTQMTVANLGVSYNYAGRMAEAIPLLEETYRSSKTIPTLGFAGLALLEAYSKAGKPAEAAKLIDELLADFRQTQPKDNPKLARQLALLGLSLLQAKGFVQAEPLLRECLTIREKIQPDVWTTFNTQSMLGGALLGQKKYADAEPLLLKGYEGMKAIEKTIPLQGSTRIPEALDRLIELYTVTNKPDEVKKYQELRAKYPMPKEKK